MLGVAALSKFVFYAHTHLKSVEKRERSRVFFSPLQTLVFLQKKISFRQQRLAFLFSFRSSNQNIRIHFEFEIKMARSFSNAKFLSSLVVDQWSVMVTRRGYAVAASPGVVGSGSVMLKKGGEESTKTTSWVPDPVTGYYRPENITNEIDAAELREMLLKNKIRRH